MLLVCCWSWVKVIEVFRSHLHPVNLPLNWPIRRLNLLLIAPQLLKLFLTFDGAIEQTRPINSYIFCSKYHKWIVYNSKWYFFQINIIVNRYYVSSWNSDNERKQKYRSPWNISEILWNWNETKSIWCHIESKRIKIAANWPSVLWFCILAFKFMYSYFYKSKLDSLSRNNVTENTNKPFIILTILFYTILF